ncbi:MAG: hypothetical protein IT480_04150, partial [Gammaproteobacteria bacterium]|nr:hypothetical protein [Gammaproteobacteria bacterium]
MHPRARDLQISRRIAADSPDWIRSDRGRIHQRLLNLGVNALRFTPAGSVERVLGRSGVRGPRLQLHGAVIDTGIGLTREQPARRRQTNQVGPDVTACPTP